MYEALASGVPLIVAKGCEAEGLVNEHGVGRAFTPLDSGELASIIVELANSSDGIEEMSKRCRELSERFDLDRIASHAEEVLDGGIGGQAAAGLQALRAARDARPGHRTPCAMGVDSGLRRNDGPALATPKMNLSGLFR